MTKGTTFFRASTDATVDYSPFDIYGTTFGCIPWALFYDYEIDVEKLKAALEKIAELYPVVCGRLKSKAGARVHVVVTKAEGGFSLTEVESEKTLKDAVVEARVVEQSAAFPSFAVLPDAFASMPTAATIDQDSPLLMLKLTRYNSGGCSLGATVHHTVADGQRLADLIVDICRAYLGEPLRTVDHDRSKGWPDQLLEKVPLGMNPKDFPRHVPTPFDVLTVPTFPEEQYAVETLFLPTDALASLKKKISAKLTEVEFVSTVDVMNTLVWMVRAELAVVREGRKEPVETAGDLAIHPSFFLYFVDLADQEGALYGKDFFGNAYIGAFCDLPAATSDEKKQQDLLDTAVEIATAIRKNVLTMRQLAAQVMTAVAIYKGLNEAPKVPPTVGGLSSFFKMSFDKMDFGNGAPVLNYGLPAYPFCDVWACICPMKNGKGALINHVVRSRDRDATINSVVLKVLLPGAKLLSEKSPEDVAALFDL